MNLSDQAARGVADPTLATLLSAHWERTLADAPVWATRLGDRRRDGELGDPSGAHARETSAFYADLRLRLATIDPGPLSVADRLTHEVLGHELEVARVIEHHAAPWSWAISTYEKAVTFVNELHEQHPVVTEADGASLIARYLAVPGWVDAHVGALREGLAAGRVAPAPPTARVVEMLDEQLRGPLPDWTVMVPATQERAWEPAAQARFAEGLGAAVASAVAPALHRYRRFLVEELLPRARGETQLGARFLPDGDAAYQAFVLQHTSLDLPAAQIHQLGLESLAEIHAELAVLGERCFGVRERSALFRRLREDPALRFTTAEEVERTAIDALARAGAAVPRCFGRLPRTPCVVRRVPDYQAPYTTIAYYRPPGAVGGADPAPGEYMINTSAPETRPRFEAEALAFHESVPGHHLQIALAMEEADLPAFRRYGLQNAYIEGWALYTERLADELGLYSGDLDRIGMLSFDTWRAARLVVDTGIHHLGWNRGQAVAFMLENTPLAENNIRNEVDRYVSWPGQALGYKLGQRCLMRLRDEARAAQGSTFSLAGFHDAFLALGPVPLRVLERQIRAWMLR